MQKTHPRAKKPEIEAIIFDIGRVIIHLDPSRAIATIGAGSGLTPEKLWDAVHKDPLWDAWQEGRVTPRKWHENLNTRFRTSFHSRNFARYGTAVCLPRRFFPIRFSGSFPRNAAWSYFPTPIQFTLPSWNRISVSFAIFRSAFILVKPAPRSPASRFSAPRSKRPPFRPAAYFSLTTFANTSWQPAVLA